VIIIKVYPDRSYYGKGKVTVEGGTVYNIAMTQTQIRGRMADLLLIHTDCRKHLRWSELYRAMRLIVSQPENILMFSEVEGS